MTTISFFLSLVPSLRKAKILQEDNKQGVEKVLAKGKASDYYTILSFRVQTSASSLPQPKII